VGVQTLPMESSYRLAVERVRANAERIRRVELPAYEQLINVRAKRYRLLADVYAGLRRRRAVVTPADEYCAWHRLLGADPGSCDCSAAADSEGPSGRGGNASTSSMPVFDGCDLRPVEPVIHHRSRFNVIIITSNTVTLEIISVLQVTVIKLSYGGQLDELLASLVARCRVYL